MDTSTPIEADDGASQNNQQRPPHHQHSVEFLTHACQCRDISCQSLECVKMKGIIAHIKVCRVRANGNCPICMHLVEVCIGHSSNCQQDVCPVPFCHNIKNRIKLQAVDGGTSMESAVSEVFASGDSTSETAATAATSSKDGIQQRIEQLTRLLSSQPTPDIQKQTLDLLKSYPTLLSAYIRDRQHSVQNLTSNAQQDFLLNQQLHHIGGSSPLFDALMQRQQTPLTNRQENAQQQETDQQAGLKCPIIDSANYVFNNLFTLPMRHSDKIFAKLRQRQTKPHSTVKHTNSLDLIHKIIRSHPRNFHHQQQPDQSEPNLRGVTTCRIFPMSSLLSNLLDKSAHQQHLMQSNESGSSFSGTSLFSSLISIMKSNQLVMAAYLRHRETVRQMQIGNTAPQSPGHQQLSSQIAEMSLSEDQNAEMQQVMDMFQKLNLPEEQKQELENVIVNQLTPNQTQQPDFSPAKSVNEPDAKDAQH